MSNRREFITLLGGTAAWPLAARAQQPTKTLKVGTVAGTPKSSPQWVAFERRMVELGYQEGRNFSFDFLQAARADEYEALYRKLAARGPDVILAIGPEIGLKSALAVTRTVPSIIGKKIVVLNASVEADFDTISAMIHQQPIGALLEVADPFFTERRNQIIALAARNRIPAIYELREFVLAGGLMSYGTSLVDAYRQGRPKGGSK